jgi:protein-S-isoprenylcysteine O-methyltransferase Ste14
MNKLLVKTFLGFVNLFTILALCLFLPAWTLEFWQAWLFLASFFLPILLFTFFLFKRDPRLLERRVKTGLLKETRPYQRFIQAFATVFFIALFLIPGFDHRFKWSTVPSFLVIVSDLAVASGLLIIFFVFRENTFTSAIVEVAKDQHVVSTGPYAVVRHPMYSGAILLLWFTPFALNSWWALLAVPPLVVVVIFRLLDEERYLIQQLAGYGEYCQMVRWKLIPGIW